MSRVSKFPSLKPPPLHSAHNIATCSPLHSPMSWIQLKVMNSDTCIQHSPDVRAICKTSYNLQRETGLHMDRSRSHARTYAHTHTHVCTQTHTHAHTHAYTRTHARMHTHTHTHTHIHTHTHTRTHARTHTQWAPHKEGDRERERTGGLLIVLVVLPLYYPQSSTADHCSSQIAGSVQLYPDREWAVVLHLRIEPDH